jgi:hypothetical protein
MTQVTKVSPPNPNALVGATHLNQRRVAVFVPSERDRPRDAHIFLDLSDAGLPNTWVHIRHGYDDSTLVAADEDGDVTVLAIDLLSEVPLDEDLVIARTVDAERH